MDRYKCPLTSRVRFKLQRIPNKWICVSNARDGNHLFPFVQVAFQQLVGDICQENNAYCRGHKPKSIHTDKHDHIDSEMHGESYVCLSLSALQFIVNLLDFGSSWQLFCKRCYNPLKLLKMSRTVQNQNVFWNYEIKKFPMGIIWRTTIESRNWHIL